MLRRSQFSLGKFWCTCVLASFAIAIAAPGIVEAIKNLMMSEKEIIDQNFQDVERAFQDYESRNHKNLK